MTVRSAEVEDAIIAGLESGTPLAQLCRELNIGVSTVYDWKDSDATFSGRIARARDIGFDAIAAECLDIADETGHDTIRTENGARADSEWISRSKLRVETRLKLLAKWDPKRYGEKLDLTSSDKSLSPKPPLVISSDPQEAQRQYERLIRGED